MLLEVARIVKPHGIKGEVVVEMISNRPELRLAPGTVLQSGRGPVEVVTARPHQHRWIVGLAGVADRNAAEALRGLSLEAESVEEDGTLWVHELVGSEVVDTTGTVHGTVQAVEAHPASDYLVLDGDRLVPLVFVVSTDARERRVVVDPPPGLLD